MGLRSRLLLLVSLAAIPALLLALCAYLQQRKQGAAKVQKEALELVQLAAAKQIGLADATRQHLAGYARLDAARGNDIRAFDGFFKGVRTIYTNYADFGMIETNGQLVSSSFGREGTTNLAERADLQRVVHTGQYSIGEFEPGNPKRAPSLLFGHPVLDPKGNLTRVLYAALNTSIMSASFADLGMPDGVVVRVFDRAGRIVAAYPHPEQWVGKSAAATALWPAILSKKTGTTQAAGLDSISRLYGFSSIEDGSGPALFVAAGVPTKAAFAETNQMLGVNLALLGVVAVSIWLIAWLYASRYLLNPVRALIDTTRQVAAGNLAARTGIGSNAGELSELAQSFDAMAARLQAERAETEHSHEELRQSERRVRELNGELEDRVRKRTAQLEQAYQELEAFSYSVSHDLRAPLRPIHGYVEMLQAESNSKLSDDGRRLLNNIARSAKRMGTLIDNLLAFSRMGRTELRHAPVSMTELVEEVIRELQDDLAGKDIRWVIDPLPEVVGDRPMLKQVWANLISNAVKYSAMRTPPLIKIGCHRKNAEHEFFVQDNGTGFDMKYAHKLFGVFERLHLMEEFEGTGIGLANVRRIVLRHGGRTWAEGQVDVGATFYFSLPQSPKSPEALWPTRS